MATDKKAFHKGKGSGNDGAKKAYKPDGKSKHGGKFEKVSTIFTNSTIFLMCNCFLA
jgi:hypothetical protein